MLVATDMPVFMPVQMLERPEAATSGVPCREARPAPMSAPARSHSGLIEIKLGNGSQVRVGSDVNLAALRRVLAALRG